MNEMESEFKNLIEATKGMPPEKANQYLSAAIGVYSPVLAAQSVFDGNMAALIEAAKPVKVRV
jgi:hypothetical protein